MMIRGDFSPRITDRLFDDMPRFDALVPKHLPLYRLCCSIPYVSDYASLFLLPASVIFCAAVIKEYSAIPIAVSHYSVIGHIAGELLRSASGANTAVRSSPTCRTH